jgi:hypothetical protein
MPAALPRSGSTVQLWPRTAGPLFVADDWAGHDRYVGADFGDVTPSTEVPRATHFQLKQRNRRYLIYHPATQSYLFCSNDKIDGDNVIEAHDPGHEAEERNEFELVPLDHGTFRIYSPKYKKYLFLSNDIRRDRRPYKLLEAHDPRHAAEVRNEFRIDVISN